MCVSLVGRITRIDGEHAVVDVGGGERRASLAMLILEDRRASTGDWVLVHTGFAVAVLDADEAAELVRLHHDVATADLAAGDLAATNGDGRS